MMNLAPDGLTYYLLNHLFPYFLTYLSIDILRQSPHASVPLEPAAWVHLGMFLSFVFVKLNFLVLRKCPGFLILVNVVE